MIQKIFKYPLECVDIQELFLPYNAEILSVMEQNEKIVLYAKVPYPIQVSQKRYVRVYGTGHSIQEEDIGQMDFLGTVKLMDGKLMFHVFID